MAIVPTPFQRLALRRMLRALVIIPIDIVLVALYSRSPTPTRISSSRCLCCIIPNGRSVDTLLSTIHLPHPPFPRYPIYLWKSLTRLPLCAYLHIRPSGSLSWSLNTPCAYCLTYHCIKVPYYFSAIFLSNYGLLNTHHRLLCVSSQLIILVLLTMSMAVAYHCETP